MPISRTFLYLQENKKHFLEVALFFIKDAKNHRDLPENAIQKHNQRAK